MVIPQRLISAIMTFTAVVLAYMLRVSISYALTQMLVHPHRGSNSTIVGADICPPFDDEIIFVPGATAKPNEETWEKYDWSQELQGLILSAFYWGYIVSHVPGGLLAAKIGGKHTITLGMAIAVIFSLITPKSIELGGPKALIVVRVIVGIGEGIIFPACNTLLAAWTPLTERSRTATVVFSGVAVGSIFGSSVSGILIHEYGWTSVFYIFGGIGIFWLLLFNVLVYNSPGSHPFISEKEKTFLQQELGQLERRTDLPPTPWKAILTNPPMLALIAAQIGHSWGLFIVVNDMPKYMNDVLRFSIKKNGLYSAMPYVFMWAVSVSSGVLSDYLTKNGKLSITNARITFTAISAVGPAVCLVLASYSGCNRALFLLMFTIAMGTMGAYYAGVKPNCIDLAPNYAGVVMAVVNGLGGATGVAGPYVVGLLTPNSYLREWRMVFWVTFVILNGSAFIYGLFASGIEQDWNEPDKKKELVEIVKQ